MSPSADLRATVHAPDSGKVIAILKSDDLVEKFTRHPQWEVYDVTECDRCGATDDVDESIFVRECPVPDADAGEMVCSECWAETKRLDQTNRSDFCARVVAYRELTGASSETIADWMSVESHAEVTDCLVGEQEQRGM